MIAYKFAAVCTILGIVAAVAVAHPSDVTQEGRFLKAAKFNVSGANLTHNARRSRSHMAASGVRRNAHQTSTFWRDNGVITAASRCCHLTFDSRIAFF